MKGYKHILIAEDFSKLSSKVRQKALDLAKLYKAEVSVCHITEIVTDYMQVLLPGVEEGMRETVLKQLAEVYTKLGIDSKQWFVEEGVPRVHIANLAVKHKVDLIIIGSHGASGVMEYFLGSTTTGVLHLAKCDVLVVRA